MFLTTVFTKVAMAINNFVVLADLDYLKTDGNGAFDQLEKVIKEYFAETYQLLLVIGVAVLVLAGVAAGILFGVLKDAQKVKENKTWLVRVLVAVAIVAGILTAVSLAFGVGEAIEESVEEAEGEEGDTAFRDFALPYGVVIEEC